MNNQEHQYRGIKLDRQGKPVTEDPDGIRRTAADVVAVTKAEDARQQQIQH